MLRARPMCVKAEALALRARVAENRQRVARLLAVGPMSLHHELRDVAHHNENVEATFLSRALASEATAPVWLAEADRWLRRHVDPRLAQYEQLATASSVP